jgi:hypothetical protein
VKLFFKINFFYNYYIIIINNKIFFYQGAEEIKFEGKNPKILIIFENFKLIKFGSGINSIGHIK